ncbi:major facilitator superfamily protein [Streptomyces eurocidicus]|uniref:Major facilitator superfamily protein n=1 Tax=Streptomyces eurocidicus TaxID=66423 RepID=A0A2N8NTF3_STREU|nr:MFS transporter [Streptomyces eurocidicus]MBB5121016.1 putative MFS family arabinose efflux permease [Streptomyces eurocidicus]MBF6055741.1 MFS transporter [Streptomyces eurocidicus]PNE32058.1 major facilitator superfamily protein [Streptomyces eurocidicus]
MTAPTTDRTLPLVLRNRAFGTVWLGQVLTQAAVRMFQVGISWWLVAYAVSGGSGLASGLFMAVSTLPAVALAPVVARAVARLAHRSLLRGAAGCAGAAATALAVWACASDLPIAAAYAATLALATCQAFFDPCLTTSVPELVDDEDIEAATGFELSTQSLASLGGALLGALIVDRAGVAGLAVGCAAAYVTAAALLATVRFRAPEQGPGDGDGAAPAPRTLRQVLSGLPFVRKILISFTAANLFTTAVFVVIPLYTKSVLDGGGGTVALLEASLGAGTLIGSFTGARVPGRPTVVGAFALAAMAVALGLPGLVGERPVIAGCLAVAGWCVGVIGVRFVALFQRLVPAADKPAFFAVMQAVLGATFPVASLLFGLLGDHLPVQTLCLIQAAGLVPAALALFLLRENAPEPEAVPGSEAAPALAADTAGGAR